MTLALLTIVAGAALAFANGANDVSKGVATLAGTGRASYRAAIAWGTVWTLAGGMASLLISIGLITAFTSGLVSADVLAVPTFALAVAIGAFGWVMFASSTGLPVSTTHALTGAIVGVALVSGGASAIKWPALAVAIIAPLAISPLVAATAGYVVQAITGRLSPACVCIRDDLAIEPLGADGALAARSVETMIATTAACDPADSRWVWMPAGTLHWASAAALSFARGVNDTAKIAAIAALGFSALGAELWLAFGATVAAMTAGSYVAGLRVTHTLGEGVVHMEQDTGLAAAFVGAGLVLAASFYTLPVSTTHVSTGAIVGAGLRQDGGSIEWRRLSGIAAAWVVTLPLAAALAAIANWTVQMIA